MVSWEVGAPAVCGVRRPAFTFEIAKGKGNGYHKGPNRKEMEKPSMICRLKNKNHLELRRVRLLLLAVPRLSRWRESVNAIDKSTKKMLRRLPLSSLPNVLVFHTVLLSYIMHFIRIEITVLQPS